MELTEFFMLEHEKQRSSKNELYVSDTLVIEEPFTGTSKHNLTISSLSLKDVAIEPFWRDQSDSNLFALNQMDRAFCANELELVETSCVFLCYVRIDTEDTLESIKKWITKDDPASENHRSAAFQMLQDIDLYVDEEDQLPSSVLRENVALLLERILQMSNLPIDVEATSEGDILVTAYNKKRDALMMYCNSNGTVFCMSNLPGKQAGERYESIESVPCSKFILDTLNLLCSESN